MLIEEQTEQFAEMEKYNEIECELEKNIIELENELDLEHLPFHNYCNLYNDIIGDLKNRLNELMQIKNKRDNITYDDILKNALKPFKFSEGFILPKRVNNELIEKINKYIEYIYINNNNSLRKVFNIQLYSIEKYERLSRNDQIGHLIHLLNQLNKIDFDFYTNWLPYPPNECKTLEDFMERCKDTRRMNNDENEGYRTHIFETLITQYLHEEYSAIDFYKNIIFELAHDLAEQANKEEIRIIEIKSKIKKNIEEAKYFSNLLAKKDK